jgi:hypothetical protein
METQHHQQWSNNLHLPQVVQGRSRAVAHNGAAAACCLLLVVERFSYTVTECVCGIF